MHDNIMTMYFSCLEDSFNTPEQIAILLNGLKDKIDFNDCSYPLIIPREHIGDYEAGISGIVLGNINYITAHSYNRTNRLRLDIWSDKEMKEDDIKQKINEFLARTYTLMPHIPSNRANPNGNGRNKSESK
ncbi:MAG: hypothetical protein FJ134_12025 [Deltaproteobacteria bacterium]|nr:hypothetical protein [Deltaproteobacteria bacterium]